MSERSAVQEPMLKCADEIGWQSISPSEAMQMREGDTAALYFADVLKAQLLKLNKGIVDDSNCADVLRQLGLLNATLEGNQEALLWMRGEKSTFVPSENRERNVTLIDFELGHLLVPNHGKLFKGYMSAYLPDWVERQNHLRSL